MYSTSNEHSIFIIVFSSNSHLQPWYFIDKEQALAQIRPNRKRKSKLSAIYRSSVRQEASSVTLMANLDLSI